VAVALHGAGVRVPCFDSRLRAAIDLSKLPPPANRSVNFMTDVEPILAANCYSCHGPRKEESGLRWDLKDAALKGGEHGTPLVAGKSAESLIIHLVSGIHPDIARMPKKGDPLSAKDIGILRAWIDQGANWPDQGIASASASGSNHWAFRAPQRPPVPKVKSRKLVRNPIDNFVEARLEKEGLQLSPEADRTSLIRRLSLDLIGLPPTPEEVDAFVADRSADAYQKVVERLLRSPHYGERWGRHWLDAARYADSNGFEKDRTRSIWPWRDWVIHALNRDLPFDQFSREQLAGDLLPGCSPDQRTATGFLRNSMINMEGGIEPEKFRTEAIIDRVDAVGRTWLGLTIACAQCHSHKFDPISQKEYYQFYAFLNQDDEPRIEVPNAEQATKRADLLSRIRAAQDRILTNTPGVAAGMAAWEKDIAGAAGNWAVVDPKEWHSQPMKFEKQEDLSLLGGGDVYPDGVLRIWWDTTLTNITGFRLEALNDANLPFNGPGLDGNGSFQLAEFQVQISPLAELSKASATDTNSFATTNNVTFAHAYADAAVPGFGITNAIDGVTTNVGWATDLGPGRRNEERRAVFENSSPIGFPGGSRLLITLYSKSKDAKVSNQIIGRVRLSFTTDAGPLNVDPLSASQRKILSVPPDQRTPEQRCALLDVYRRSAPTLAEANKEIDELWSQWPGAEAMTLALSSRPVARQTRVFKRGDWLRPTVVVEPDVPTVLHSFPGTAPRNRLGLAEWIMDRRNPLTSRVMINRIWQEYFGQGLVTSPEDFGTRADKPSHPELLDWLAIEFMDRGWSLKAMHRLIVNSATYRQSSRVTPQLLEKDPYNRLLSRGPRFRVDSEIVQDIALSAAGLLSPKIGGPSVFPPLPDGVMQLAYGPIPWNVSEGDDRYRRGMYTFWKRSVPYPALTTFDSPQAEQSCVRRVRSNTPLQALITLNEPTFNNAARWLAWRLLNDTALNDQARMSRGFRLVLARKPSPKEAAALMSLLDSARADFDSRPKDAALFAFADPKNPAPLPDGVNVPRLAAWTTVSRALLNLDETVTKE
jgi:hypothetical protein